MGRDKEMWSTRLPAMNGQLASIQFGVVSSELRVEYLFAYVWGGL